MTLLNPWGLAGLLSLPVIVALHLLRERRRRFIVSDVSLWKFLENEPRGPRTRRLPITPLLLLDLLIASLLSLALAQPRLTLSLPERLANHRILLVDVSTSMRASDGFQSRIEKAKAAAASIVAESGPNDRVTLITFGLGARRVADSRDDGPEQLRERLSVLQAGETAGLEASHMFEAALALGQAEISDDLQAEFHVFTDGAFADGALQESGGLNEPLKWHWFRGSEANQAVTQMNATAVSPERLEIFIRVANYHNQDVEREATLEINGRTITQARLNIPADSSVTHFWTVAVDAVRPPLFAGVHLNGSDALVEDDRAVIGLQSGGVMRVALVSEEPAPLQQAVEVYPGVELTLIAPQDYSTETQAGFDMTIFRDYLPAVWPSGQILVVEPPGATEAGAAPLAAGGRVAVPADAAAQAPQRNMFVEGLDFSGVRWGRAISLSSRPSGFVTLLQAGEVPLLLGGQVESVTGGRSQILVLLADLGRGNFTRQPAFPILIANLIATSRRSPLPSSFYTGEAVGLPSAGIFQAIHVEIPGREAVEMESPWPDMWGDTLEPGLYRFRLSAADGASREFVSGANAGETLESDLRPQGWTQSAEDISERMLLTSNPEQREIDLWIWLLIAALPVLIAEAFLAWRSA